MTAQEETLARLVQVLDTLNAPYMIIGGIANIVWGEPRATLDIDVTVWIEDAAIEGFINGLGEKLRVLVERPAAFVHETRVLPVESPAGVRIDVVFGLLPFEREAIDRAVAVDIGNVRVRVCTAEDLILMKIVSDRERDLTDARSIAQRRFQQLDREYLEPRIRELALLLERPDIEARWRDWTRPSEST